MLVKKQCSNHQCNDVGVKTGDNARNSSFLHNTIGIPNHTPTNRPKQEAEDSKLTLMFLKFFRTEQILTF